MSEAEQPRIIKRYPNRRLYDRTRSRHLTHEELYDLVVAGHTDSSGSDDYNQRLSEQRARSVSDYLESRELLRDRLEPVGFGERQPIAPNDSVESRALNRRVEITLLPVTA